MAEVIFVIVPIAIVVIVGVVFTLAVRGKQLKCPDCGTVFNAPTVDNKISGLGGRSLTRAE